MVDENEVRRKRLLYRSSYTGTKETDVLLGAFAKRHLDGLTSEQLDQYEHLMTIEDPRLYKWITGQEHPPEEFDSEVLAMIKNFDLNA